MSNHSGFHPHLQAFSRFGVVKTLQRLRWWLLLFLLILAPFHAFLITWLKSLLGDTGSAVIIISIWREIIVGIVIVLALVELLNKRALPRFDLLDWLIIAYGLLSLLWLPLQWDSKTEWLLGVRFDVMPFILLLVVRHIAWPRIITATRAILITSAIVLIFGLLHALVLPPTFLTYFGYSQNQNEYQPDIAISSCQYLEHTNRVCRATSTFGGPTRYGTYALLVLGLVVGGYMAHGTEWRKKRWTVGIAVIGALAIINAILTYSRSIWIGLLAMAGFSFFWFVPRKNILKIIIGATVALAASILLWQLYAYTQNLSVWSPPPFIKTIFVRETSSGQHAQLFKAGLKIVAEHPLGIGLGTVGPASVRFEKFLTENWYLQIADEMGIPGLLLFLGILFMLVKKLLSDRSNMLRVGLGMTLLGITVAGLFTHSFEETSTMLIWAALAGILLPISSSNA